MKNKIEISAAAGMVPSRDLRRRRVFGILSAMGLMATTALIGAERAANSFVTVEGDGVRIADDGSIHFPNAKSPVAVEVTARPGWKVNGSESVSFTRAPGDGGPLLVTCDLGEGSYCIPLVDCQFGNDVSNRHVAPPAISIEGSERLIYMYALPGSNVLVSASATCETVSNGVHEIVTKWLPCPGCHALHDPAEETNTVSVAPEIGLWTASGAGVETNSNAWTCYMTKGKGQKITFRVDATNDCAECRTDCHASTNVVVDVHELSIDLPDEFLGLDMTDAGKGKYVTRTAIANVDPAPARAEYLWAKCGRCDIIGAATNAIVTYGATNQTGPSDAYRAEELIVNGTAYNEAGDSASAMCTTNFTVVKVDIELSNVGEDGDETARPSVEYVVDDEGGGLSKTGLRSLYPVKVTCEPSDVPGTVDLAVSSGARLFEITSYEDNKPTAAVPAQSSYLCSEIGQKKFGIHGHSVSVLDVGELMVARHELSGACDNARVKVVPPPSLEVSVEFKSPAKGGGWPYDPVWDDPEWAPTVNGSLAKQCAEDTDNALVIYTLSRDAKTLKGVVYKTSSWPDEEVDSFVGVACEGVHTNFWEIGPTRQVDEYYAKVFAEEKETDEIRRAKSNEGGVRRECYYFSDSVRDPLPVSAYSRVTLAESIGPQARRVTIDLVVAYVASAVVAARIAAWASAYGFTNAEGLGFVSGFAISEIFDISHVGIDEKWGTQRALYAWNVTRYDWKGTGYIKYYKPNPNYNPDSTGVPPVIGPHQIGYFPPEFAMLIEKYRRIDGSETTEKTTYRSLEKGYDEGNENTSKWRWENKPYQGGYGMTCPQLNLPDWNY